MNICRLFAFPLSLRGLFFVSSLLCGVGVNLALAKDFPEGDIPAADARSLDELGLRAVKPIDERVAIYHAAWESWSLGTVCQGEYEVWIWNSPDNLKDELGKVPDRPASAVRQSYGSLVKMKEWTKLSVLYDQPLVEGQGLDGNVAFGNAPWTSITNGHIGIEHSFDPRAKESQVISSKVRVRHVQPDDLPESTGFGTATVLTPFQYGLDKMKLFELPSVHAGQVHTEETRIGKSDSSHRTVQLHRTYEDGTEMIKRILFDVSHDLPRFEGLKFEIAKDGRSGGVQVVLDRFVEGTSGFVPQRVTKYLYGHGINGSLVSQWVSDNLKVDSAPKEEFLLKVSADTKIRGLTEIPRAVDGYRIINPFELPGNIYDGEMPLRSIVNAETKDLVVSRTPVPFKWLPLIVANAVVIIGICSRVLYLRARNPFSPHEKKS